MSRNISNTLIVAIACVFLVAAKSVEAAEDDKSLSLSASADSDGVQGNADADTEGEPPSTQLYRPTHDRFNLHLGVGYVWGPGTDLSGEGYNNNGVQGTVGFDIVLAEPLALSFQGGFNSMIAGDNLDGVTSAFVGGGFRLRFFSDTNGALADGGTAAGNLWLDAHFDYVNHLYQDHGGYDIGLGYEWAFFKNVNIGPYVRFQHVAFGDGLNYLCIAGGIAMSIAGDTGPKDMDLDGVNDDLDSCPMEPEDKDGFNDDDGCPDLDNDEDGIADGDDECPEVAGIPEKNGCPETDNDKDGILNETDMCIDEAEDMDGFEDEDGCPEADNDNDGILDINDKCIDVPEDMDGFEDTDGCPDDDNDGDGVKDADDQCPNEAETVNGKEDEDGCPDLVRVVGDQIKILQKVYFKTGKAKILGKSNELLDEVAAVIKAKPAIKVRVEGHTDDVGRDKKNMKLSQDRADSVKKYLLDAGVDADRLVAEGKGETMPIADNKTKEGKAQNRRVEFHIVKEDGSEEAMEPQLGTPVTKEPAPKKSAPKKADAKEEKSASAPSAAPAVKKSEGKAESKTGEKKLVDPYTE